MLAKTNSVLLAGLADPGNAAVWTEFDARYRPVIVAFAARLGLQPADGDELAQSALVRFAEEYRAGRYDRERGRLRSWIFGIARHCAAELRRERARLGGMRGESALGELVGDSEAERCFDEEWRRALLRHAFAELRAGTKTDESTVRVVEMLALEQRPVAEVAAALHMTSGAVYTAKHRALASLREILDQLETDW
jgi:RNA polymerase sigma-70 factor (ECF subfamily)